MDMAFLMWMADSLTGVTMPRNMVFDIVNKVNSQRPTHAGSRKQYLRRTWIKKHKSHNALVEKIEILSPTHFVFE
jgi:hypothetical protein